MSWIISRYSQIKLHDPQVCTLITVRPTDGHISQRAVRVSLEKQLDARGSVPVFLRPTLITCDFPEGGGGTFNLKIRYLEISTNGISVKEA